MDSNEGGASPDQCALIEWNVQTTLPEFFDEYVHNMDDAIAVGKRLLEVEQDIWKAIGHLALHVEKGQKGRGYEGGLRAFCRGIGRAESTVRHWMSQVQGYEKMRQFGAFSKGELTQSHYEVINEADNPAETIEYIEREIQESKDGKAPPAAHVALNTGNNEWYTPPEYIDAATRLMGRIEVDPASTAKANKIVKANRYYTRQEDGLKQEWRGNVWMNPPYAQPLVTQFCDLFVEKYESGEIAQGCVLVNNATETKYFQRMLKACSAVCFIKGRVPFLDVHGDPGAPLQGQALLYFGENTTRFETLFREFGVILHA